MNMLFALAALAAAQGAPAPAVDHSKHSAHEHAQHQAMDHSKHAEGKHDCKACCDKMKASGEKMECMDKKNAGSAAPSQSGHHGHAH